MLINEDDNKNEVNNGGGSSTDQAMHSEVVGAGNRWDSLMMGIDRPSSLSANGKKFIDDLRQHYKNGNTGFFLEAVSTDRLSGAIIFTDDGNFGYAIGLAESYICSGYEWEPPTYAIQDIIAQRRNKYPTTRIIQGIIVHPEDYDRMEDLATTIKTAINVGTDAAWSAQFSKKVFEPMKATTHGPADLGSEIFVSSDTGKIRSFVAKQLPHAILPRMDFGLGAIIRPYRGKKNPMHQDTSGNIAMAVGAYMEFVPLSGAMGGFPTQFRSLIKSSVIASSIPHKNLYPILLPLIIQQFIDNGGWYAQYKNGYATGTDVGKLVSTPDGQHYRIESDQSYYEFMNHALPIDQVGLVLEVDDSRTRIPGADMLIDDDTAFYTAIKDFYELDDNAFTARMQALGYTELPKPIITSFQEVIGIVNENGDLYDSRHYDYLKLTENYSDPAQLQPLFYRNANDPFDRLKTLSNYGLNVKPAGTCTNLVVNPDFVRLVSVLFANDTLSNRTEFEFNPAVGMYHNSVDFSGAGGYNFGNMLGGNQTIPGLAGNGRTHYSM